MKKSSKGLLFLSAIAVATMVSCSDDAPWTGSSDQGGIALDFSTDSRIMRSSRADDSQSPVVPDPSAFAVSIEKSDGSYSKNWSSVDGFNREKSFPIGDYTLSAYYGNVDEEGFTSPFYKGTTEVHVSPGAESTATVVATLANAMVSVRYTDDFADNFPQYSAAVQTEGHSKVVYAQNETRPAYIAPAKAKLNLTLTNDAGEQVTIQPAEFTAVARHHYVITIGVDGSAATGNLSLNVEFDEDVVAETVQVPLGDEIFSSPAPTISANGFKPEVAIESVEYAAIQSKPELHVFAYGGIKSAVLNVISSAYIPDFGKSVELVNADATTQQLLVNAGVDASGFYRNADKLGVVNLTKFVENLPAGQHTVELQVTDALTRTSEPIALKINKLNLEYEITAAEQADFMAPEIKVNLTSNTPDVKDKFIFQVPDANNRMVDAKILKVESLQVETGSYKFCYTLALDPQVRGEIDVNAVIGKKSRSCKVAMLVPQCTVETDAFARRVLLKLDVTPASVSDAFIQNLIFFNGSTQIPSSNVNYDKSSGVITITGLTPGSVYNALSMQCVNYDMNIPSFTTEAETAVNNGSFGLTTKTIDINPIQVGGLYHTGIFDYYNRTSLSYYEPTGWASVNKNTCWTGSSNINTWFLVPSTYVESGMTVIRSVGYSHAGTTPAKVNTGTSRKYYNTNAPSDAQLSKAAGELFLGSYNFNGSESRVDGVAFASRPASVSFRYKYVPVNNEKGEAYVRVYDAQGTQIAGGTLKLNASSTMQTQEIALSGYPFGKKAAKIQLGFRSTESGVTPAVKIPSGDALYEDGVKLNTDYYWTLAENTYHALATGSVLTIDDVQINYSSSSSFSKPRATRANKK